MSQAPKSLQALLQAGGLIDVTESQYDDVFKLAQAADITAITVECDRARSLSAVLRAVVKAVEYPEFIGKDLDALYDCLCDTVLDQKTGLYLWFNKLHTGDPALAEDAEAILSICNDVADFFSNKGRYFGYTIMHSGKHPDPEPGVTPAPYAGGFED